MSHLRTVRTTVRSAVLCLIALNLLPRPVLAQPSSSGAPVKTWIWIGHGGEASVVPLGPEGTPAGDARQLTLPARGARPRSTGDRAAWIVLDDGEISLRVTDLPAGQPRTLWEGGVFSSAHAPSWSRSGRWLVTGGRRKRGDSLVHLERTDGTQAQFDREGSGAALSPDDSTVVVTTGRRLELFTPPAPTVTSLCTLAEDEGGDLDWPAFSHDGNWVLCTVLAPGGGRNLIVVDARAGSARTLLSGEAGPICRWSPKELRIASNGNEGALVVVDARTGDVVRRVAPPARAPSPGWSEIVHFDWTPDGRHVVFSNTVGIPASSAQGTTGYEEVDDATGQRQATTVYDLEVSSGKVQMISRGPCDFLQCLDSCPK